MANDKQMQITVTIPYDSSDNYMLNNARVLVSQLADKAWRKQDDSGTIEDTSLGHAVSCTYARTDIQ